MKVSVVIPTHNRQQKVLETVKNLRRQSFSAREYEIILIDDGSTPPVVLPKELSASLPKTFVVRLEGVERSAARNTGAEKAAGELLIFIDDDIAVSESFVSDYWQAHREFPGALFVGSIFLPEESKATPFGRFRQKLENTGVPPARGEIAQENYCSAGNMAIAAAAFRKISGFDLLLTSAEDQDFALRHSAAGGKIVFVPEARGVHYDNALDIRSYCRRNEWGSRLMIPFYRRYPHLPANVERRRVNGEIKWREEPFLQTLRKITKSFIASPLFVEPLFLLTDILERFYPNSKSLSRIYQMLLGAYIFRGYRAALKQVKRKAWF